jgi:ubiquinone/menaquinone biosynthesis C-methylase UbiE
MTEGTSAPEPAALVARIHRGEAIREARRLAGIYRWYAPIYDLLFAHMYRSARVRSVASLKLVARDQVLIAGVGTGLDLPELPPGVSAIGLDASAAMLSRARLAHRVASIHLLVGDAQIMPFADAAFDVVILHLVLSVVPDPSAAFREVMRVVKPGGRIAVLDKFGPDSGASWLRRAVNGLVRWSGTDITRRLGDIIERQPVQVASHETALLGNYQLVLLDRHPKTKPTIRHLAMGPQPMPRRHPATR